VAEARGAGGVSSSRGGGDRWETARQNSGGANDAQVPLLGGSEGLMPFRYATGEGSGRTTECSTVGQRVKSSSSWTQETTL
jgi:hypothetical protein